MRWRAAAFLLLLLGPVVAADDPVQYLLEGSLVAQEPLSLSGLVELEGTNTVVLRQVQEGRDSTQVPGGVNPPPFLPDGSPILFAKAAPIIPDAGLIGHSNQAVFRLHRWVYSGTEPPTYSVNRTVPKDMRLEVIGHLSPPQALLQTDSSPDSHIELAEAECDVTNPAGARHFDFPSDDSNVADARFHVDELPVGRLSADCHAASLQAANPSRVVLYGYELDVRTAESRQTVRTGTFREAKNQSIELPTAPPSTPVIQTVTQFLEIEAVDRSLSIAFYSGAQVEFTAPAVAGAGELATPASSGELTWGDVHLEGSIPPWTGPGAFLLSWRPDGYIGIAGSTTAPPPLPDTLPLQPAPPAMPPVAPEEERAPPVFDPPVSVTPPPSDPLPVSAAPQPIPPKPSVSLLAPDHEGSEDDVTLIRTGPGLDEPLRILYQVQGPGTPVEASLVIEGGKERVTIRLRQEPTEQTHAALTFTVSEDPAYTRAEPHSAILTAQVETTIPRSVPAWVVAASAGVGLLLLGAAAGLFSRLQRHKMLDHPRRAQILEFVRQQPGVEMNTVAKTLQIPWARVADHLATLERGEYVKLTRIGGRTAVFPANEGYRGKEEKVVLLRRPHATRLLEILQRQPGADQGAIRVALGLSQPRVSRLLGALSRCGLIDARRSERRLRYFQGGAPHTGTQTPSYASIPLNAL